ncbi:SDR family NAD(P)-dependent oxidoreductase [Actinomadura macrotermitis]|uniref:Putative oxidoreductase n=1 Tax=Actinomadura macrotermitis TaxID=2585200 RepID=A0A7K0BQW9_9ACTN|nr:SDR family NAD(P)-dependent oxidoreductase [Actinomadura macrotermitis]MQY03541.1 putative oxidoreductase [Actinomadura macrotermitis]
MAAASLRGRRIVLTGASSGIGRALAVALARRGAELAVTARREPLLRELATEITGAGGPAPHILPADLSRPGAAAGLAAQARDALGGADILINNAGVPATGSVAAHGDDAEARAWFETNLWTPLALTAALLPALRAADRGVIVNVTSTLQAVPLPMAGYYGAAKSALAQATRSLRHELRDTRIQVVEVVPGSTDTALRDLDRLPWRSGRPPRTLPPTTPEAVAAAVVRALETGRARVVHPSYSRLPLELPAVGRLVAALAARRIDTAGAG